MGHIVCKFGGTSLANADQIKKAAGIIKENPFRRFVVPSAPGKRSPKDIKITDLLLACHDLAAKGLGIDDPFGILSRRYTEIVSKLGLDLDIRGLLNDIRDTVTRNPDRDWTASRGEFLCGKIMAGLLGAEFVDPADYIKFTDSGDIDENTYNNLAKALSGAGLYVIPGFYGAKPDGKVKTFPRGGSDITGSIVARAVNAEKYENWTDVPGFLMTDPRIVPDARPMREVTYKELRELSYMGATVLHDEAIFPVRKIGIPIHILDTNAPSAPGTLIVPAREPDNMPVVGIAGRKNFSLIFIEKALMNKEIGFGRRVLEIVESHGISYEHSPTGIDSLGVIVKEEELGDKAGRLLKDISRVLEPDRVDIIKGLALIATVGEGMMYRVGTAARLFTALAQAGVNVRVIDQGSSEISIIVGVDNKDFEPAVKAIYHAFTA